MDETSIKILIVFSVLYAFKDFIDFEQASLFTNNIR